MPTEWHKHERTQGKVRERDINERVSEGLAKQGAGVYHEHDMETGDRTENPEEI